MKNLKIMLWYDVEDFITPEADLPSVVCGRTTLRELAKAVQEQYDRVLGFKQLLYRIGENLVNPIDVFCSLRRAAAEGTGMDDETELSVGEGRLLPTRHINTGCNWAKDWIIFPDNLDASLLVRHALLQTWTLKPALF